MLFLFIPICTAFIYLLVVLALCSWVRDWILSHDLTDVLSQVYTFVTHTCVCVCVWCMCVRACLRVCISSHWYICITNVLVSIADDVQVSDWMKTELSEKQRQTQISERAMAFVAREASDVMEIGRLMGFNVGRLRQFQASSAIPSSQISTLFSAWRNQKSTQATVENFVRLMRDALVDEEQLRKVITREYPPDDATA